MNNFFSIQRFSMLLNKHHKDQLKTNLLSMAVVLALVCVLLGLSAYSHRQGIIDTKIQEAVFSFFLFMGVLIYTSRIFAELGNKKKAIQVLLLPASHFEKFLVAWVSSYLVFPLVFTACYLAVDLLVLNITKSLSGTDNQLFTPFAEDTKLLTLMVSYTMLHALAFLGAIFFNRMHLVKTGLVTFIFCLFLFLVNKPIVSLIFKRDVSLSVPFAAVSLRNGGSIIAVSASDKEIDELKSKNLKGVSFDVHSLQIVRSMIFTAAFLLWATAYFKLKEKQV